VCCHRFCSTQLLPGHIKWIEGSIPKPLKLTGKNFECTDHVRPGFDVMTASVQLRTVIQSNLEVRNKMVFEFMTCKMPFSDNNH